MTTPTPSASFNADTVTPGVWGFVAIFLIAVLTVLLVLDMTRRIRRQRYLAEMERREAADDAAEAAAALEPKGPAARRPSGDRPPPAT